MFHVDSEETSFFTTWRWRQNGRNCADDIFKRSLLKEDVYISIKFQLSFVPKGPCNNVPALVQIMAWHRSSHYLNRWKFTDAYMRHSASMNWYCCIVFHSRWLHCENHDDVIKWKTFSALLPICAGNSPVPVNSPHKGQLRGALMLSLISAWINGCVNNLEVGDLRCNPTHYDVIVMCITFKYILKFLSTCFAQNISNSLSWFVHANTPISSEPQRVVIFNCYPE